MSKNIIIIGSGIGGLATAARLLSKNYKVTIIEKNSTIGGRTNYISESDFKFDLSASIIMLPEDYIELFSYCNKAYTNYFSLLQLNTTYKAIYYDNTNYDFSTDLSKLSSLFKSTNNNINDYFDFLSSSYYKHNLAERFFLNRPFNTLSEFLNVNSISNMIKINPFTSCSQHIKKYIKNDKLTDYLLFQSMYIGISPYHSPNIYNLIPAVSQIYGLYHIMGGMYSYVKALEKLILELGGEILTSKEVDKIIIKNNKACGVTVDGTDMPCDIVVSNADFFHSISTLIEKSYVPNKYFPNKYFPIEKFKHSCSAFILHLGINKKYDFFSVHNLYINNNFKVNIEAPFNGKLSENPSMYIYCPSSIDASMAPKDCEAINVMIRVPNLLYENISWDINTFSNLRDLMVSTLSSIPELKDIAEHIVYESFTTPLDFQDKFNCFAGNCFGLGHNLNQVNYFRPQCKLSNIKNLYFTGASTHPGNGVSMVIKSSKICCETILLEHSNY